MNKQTYLILLFLIGLQFFKLSFLSPLFNNSWGYVTILGIWLIYGFFKWGKNNIRFCNKELKYWYWIIIGICSSMIPIYFEIGQSLFHSIWIYRTTIITYCCIPVLISIRFSYKEIIDSTFKFAIIYAIFFIILTIFPTLKIDSTDELGEIKVIAENDYGYTLEGLSLLLFPLYAFIVQYTKGMNNRVILLKITFLYLLIFFIQNRSLLFPASIIIIFLLWKKKYMARIAIIITVILVICIPKINPFQTLITQTKEETSSKEYNRNIAYTYYLEKNFSSPQQFLFGQGIKSSHLSNQQEQMKELSQLGINPSDVGFLGFMNLYGIIPIIIFCVLLFKPLIHWNSYPLDTKLMSIHILICSLTISYFESFNHTIWFAIYFTLLFIKRKSSSIITR